MIDLSTYRKALRALLTPAERRTFARLDTPQKVQTFLDRLPPNFELDGETTMSPRRSAEGAHGAIAPRPRYLPPRSLPFTDNRRG